MSKHFLIFQRKDLTFLKLPKEFQHWTSCAVWTVKIWGYGLILFYYEAKPT